MDKDRASEAKPPKSEERSKAANNYHLSFINYHLK